MSTKELKDDKKISDFNLQSITTVDYSQILTGSIHSGTNLAVFGRRGSGKTEIAKQTIKTTLVGDEKPTKPLQVYINLSVAERTDMGGYPDMFGAMESAKKLSEDEKIHRFVNYILPTFFEAMIVGDRPVVALFDEVDKADASILAPLLEITQFREINGRALKNLHSCIFTGNLISEGSERPSLPLLDRCEKYLVQADTNSFLNWAAASLKIHPSIMTFLEHKPGQLYGSLDGAGDLYAEQSPRGWEYASRALFYGEKHGWSPELMLKKVSGFVGKSAGIEYDIYFTHYHELMPLVKRIFKGEDVKQDYKDMNRGMKIYAAMIVCSMLAGILDKAKASETGTKSQVPELINVGKFLTACVEDEDVFVSVRTQLTLQRVVEWGLDTHKDWTVLAQATKHVTN